IVRRNDTEHAEDRVSIRNPHIRQCEIWIACDCTLEQLEPLPQSCFVTALAVKPAADVQLVRLRILRISSRCRWNFADEVRCQCGPHLRRDRVLYQEDVGEVLVVALGPELPPVLDVDE